MRPGDLVKLQVSGVIITQFPGPPNSKNPSMGDVWRGDMCLVLAVETRAQGDESYRKPEVLVLANERVGWQWADAFEEA